MVKAVSSKLTQADEVHIIQDHIHAVQKVAPTGVDPVELTGGAQWVLGVFGNDIIAAAAVSNVFDVHHVILSGPDTNEDYEVAIFGAAIEIARVAFTRTGVFTGSLQIPVVTPLQPAGTQIRAKCMDGGAGGGAKVSVKVAYHEY